MIPILYDKNETEFTSNGLGRLSDCIRCIVTEQRNGLYECEFEYPVNGIHFDDITVGRVIACTHDDYGDIQPFDIYSKSEPINGIVTFNAHHISYRLNEITVKPFNAGTVALALQNIKSYSVTTNPFTFWTDRSSSAQFVNDVPRKARNMLGGEENSILDVFGTGEYEFDNFTVRLYAHRGQDTNISIRYAKNLTNFENDYDIQDSYTAVVPFWKGQNDQSEDVLVTLSEWYILSGHTVDSGRVVCVPMDLSTEFDTPPTEAQLRTKAQSRLSTSEAWNPNQTVKINFVQLWQTEEYRDYAPLQRVRLCDTVGVFVPMYNMSLRAKVISVTYNTLLDRYDSMTLGDKPTTYAHVIEKQYDSKVAGIEEGFNSINASINSLTQDVNTKTAIFYGSPSGTYSNVKTGDYLVDNSTGSTYRWSGSAWVVQTDYETAIANATATIQDDIDEAIENATEQILGGTGGYVITTVNANGQPIELLITDNLDINQAQNVWRWNQGGFGHSSTGYNGTYTTAITQNGHIVADFIDTGSLVANIIKTGIVSSVNGKVYFDLDNNELACNLLKGDYVRLYLNNIATGTSGNDVLILLNKYQTDTNGISLNPKQHSIQSTSGVVLAQCGYSDTYYNTTGDYLTIGGTDNSSSWRFKVKTPNTYYEHRYDGYIYESTSTFRKEINAYGGVHITGNLNVSGTKTRVVETDSYGKRALYCYETPSPIFGDIGECILDKTGMCIVDIDEIFSETIDIKHEYQVFLQKEGQGDCWVEEKTPTYFVIKGTPNLKVAWEIKNRQLDYNALRLDEFYDGYEIWPITSEENGLFEERHEYIEEQEDLLNETISELYSA